MSSIAKTDWISYGRLTIRCAQAALQSLKLAIYPPVCELCGQTSLQHYAICEACIETFNVIEHPCRRCGAPLHPSQKQTPGKRQSCMHCRRGKWVADEVLCLAVYQARIQEAVISMKHPHSEALCTYFGKRLAAHARQHIDLSTVAGIVSVPHYWRKRISKRHNSSELIAATFARELHLPLYANAMVRIRQGEKQGTLHRAERERNMEGAFKVHPLMRQVNGKHFIVVDDIITSGATAAAMTRPLKAAGARKITFVAVARGLNVASVGCKTS